MPASTNTDTPQPPRQPNSVIMIQLACLLMAIYSIARLISTTEEPTPPYCMTTTQEQQHEN